MNSVQLADRLGFQVKTGDEGPKQQDTQSIWSCNHQYLKTNCEKKKFRGHLSINSHFFFVFVYQESSVAEVENEISRDILDISNTTTRIRQLQDIMENLNDEIHQKNGTISKIEGEIVKRNAIIERKQSTIDQYNKRIDQMRSKDGVCDESSMYKLV